MIGGYLGGAKATYAGGVGGYLNLSWDGCGK